MRRAWVVERKCEAMANDAAPGTNKGKPTVVVAADPAGQSRWEDEGGAGPRGASDRVPEVPKPVAPVAASDAVTKALDARQDELMTKASTDGRPPTHSTRMREWRWLAVGAVILVLGAGAFVLITGADRHSVVAGVIAAGVMLAAAAPVLAPGVLRGREERAAKRAADKERIEVR